MPKEKSTFSKSLTVRVMVNDSPPRHAVIPMEADATTMMKDVKEYLKKTGLVLQEGKNWGDVLFFSSEVSCFPIPDEALLFDVVKDPPTIFISYKETSTFIHWFPQSKDSQRVFRGD